MYILEQGILDYLVCIMDMYTWNPHNIKQCHPLKPFNYFAIFNL